MNLEIIIIFIIITIIGNLIKAAGQAQQQTRRQYTGIPKSGGYSAEGTDETYSSSMSVPQYEAGLPSDKVSYNPEARNVTFSESSAPMAATGPAADDDAYDIAEREQHRIDFSEKSIINAIVLAELLAPPKALRKYK